MRADPMTEARVMATLHTYAQAYAEKDSHLLMKAFATDPDVVVYGTAPGEKREGVPTVLVDTEKAWEKYDAANLTFEWHSVSRCQNAAWVAADCTATITIEGEEKRIPLRMTAALEQRTGEWLILQLHISRGCELDDQEKPLPG